MATCQSGIRCSAASLILLCVVTASGPAAQQRSIAVTSARAPEPNAQDALALLSAVRVEVPVHQSFSVGQELRIRGTLHNSSDNEVYVIDSLLHLRLPAALTVATREQSEWLKASLPPGVRGLPNDPAVISLGPNDRLPLTWVSEMALLPRLHHVVALPSGDFTVESSVQVAFAAPGQTIARQWRPVSWEHPGAIELQWSFLLLLPWLWLGGWLVVTLQLVFGSVPIESRKVARVGAALAAAFLLTTVIGVVSALTDQAPFLPSIDMRSPFEALGTGMVIQLLGYRYYAARLPGSGASRQGNATG
jgi:hypothetical protein